MDEFRTFFAEEYPIVVRALRLAISDAGNAEELAQEAFARAWSRWRIVSVMERPVAWVYVVALNVERRRWRRQRDRPDGPTVALSEPDVAVGVVESIHVRDAIHDLPARQRTAIALRYLADLQIRDVAIAMGCAEGTVKATLHQALRALRVELEDDDAR